ncbi:hypothetical protein ACI3QN_13020, partial [Propionibacterium freudenreichii]|uniref:hypothetical protein n=1 Tax=Propionibacterium freudenreichii TaxID=1744 RepID=UPI0038529C7B
TDRFMIGDAVKVSPQVPIAGAGQVGTVVDKNSGQGYLVMFEFMYGKARYQQWFGQGVLRPHRGSRINKTEGLKLYGRGA